MAQRETRNTRQRSINIGPRDADIIAEIRKAHGLSFNGAVRYALRYAHAQSLTGYVERAEAHEALEAWKEMLLAGRRPGVAE